MFLSFRTCSQPAGPGRPVVWLLLKLGAAAATAASASRRHNELLANNATMNEVYRPDVPRAYQAVDSKHPEGSKGLSIPTYTVLQQHAAFWDRDNDGRIYPYDTYVGCREIGMSLLLSLAFVWLLHFTLLAPYMTQDNWLLHPYLAIHLKNIHRLHHASDTGTYDEEGRMYPRKFEEIWEVLGAEQLASWADVRRLLAANRCVGDPLGWLASAVSWGLLYSVARDERGVLGREAVRRCFDGTLFYALAEGRRARALASKYE